MPAIPGAEAIANPSLVDGSIMAAQGAMEQGSRSRRLLAAAGAAALTLIGTGSVAEAAFAGAPSQAQEGAVPALALDGGNCELEGGVWEATVTKTVDLGSWNGNVSGSWFSSGNNSEVNSGTYRTDSSGEATITDSTRVSAASGTLTIKVTSYDANDDQVTKGYSASWDGCPPKTAPSHSKSKTPKPPESSSSSKPKSIASKPATHKATPKVPSTPAKKPVSNTPVRVTPKQSTGATNPNNNTPVTTKKSTAAKPTAGIGNGTSVSKVTSPERADSSPKAPESSVSSDGSSNTVSVPSVGPTVSISGETSVANTSIANTAPGTTPDSSKDSPVAAVPNNNANGNTPPSINNEAAGWGVGGAGVLALGGLGLAFEKRRGWRGPKFVSHAVQGLFHGGSHTGRVA